MKIDMWLYNRICEITKKDYEASKSDDEEYANLYRDIDNIIYDLVEEYDVLEEKYCDLKEDIKENYELKRFNPYEEYGLDESNFH